MKSFVLGVIATLVVLLGVGVVTIYSGAYNVAADKPDTAIEAWILGTAMTNSIKVRASGTTPPSDLDSEARVHAGFHLFDEMCVQCHGAPGKQPGEVGKGLRPEPPDLTKAASRWNTAELFWIVNHGIRATGMPAFGGTHTGEQLWNIVAFVAQLPGLSTEKYNALGGQHDHEPRDHEQRDHDHHDHDHHDHQH